MKHVVKWIPLGIRLRSRNTQPHLNRDQPTHNEWVATARMSSETAPVSEPVYGYWVDKRVPADVDES